MQSLTSPVTTQTEAAQSGWCELYDFYLSAPIATPFGTVSILRLCNLPGGFAFFTPKIAPEASGTMGNAQQYSFWPLKRQIITSSSKFTNDKLTVIASAVTGDWANMLDEVDWEGVAITIRKVSLTLAGAATADDCAIIFSGNVDSAKGTLQQIQFTVSNDLGTFQVNAPRENMHANCRFNWADDQCTMIRFLAANYKTKTVGSGSTTTDIKSSGLTEDTGSKGVYGTDLIDALADASLTASSSMAIITNTPIHFPGLAPQGDFVFSTSGVTVNIGQPVTLGGSPPAPFATGTTYYIVPPLINYNTRHGLSATFGGAPILQTGADGGTTLTIGNPIAPKYVRNSYGGGNYWGFDTTGTDWGTLLQGYWQIPDAQAGMKNGALKPYIQFDFGSAVQPCIWQVEGINSGSLEDLPRLIQFFSSTNATTWNFEMYFEMPPILGGLYDVLIPNASTARYWRICIRTRWSATLRSPIFNRVSAYAGSRNFWANGIVTFASNTTTAALQNVSVAILESYAGELVCAPLPVAPVASDTFIIERGCGRTFNACCARGNTENFGGFNTLPYVSIVTDP